MKEGVNAKKEYLAPEFSLLRMNICDVIMTSVEELSSHIGDPGDWGDEPFFDDDP